MRLTKFTDYSLRVLLLAASRGETHTTIRHAASAFGISEAHLKKVVRHLIGEGLLSGSRGRSGGFMLAVAPDRINLGDVIRRCEPDFGVFECMTPKGHCLISNICSLPAIGDRALRAYLREFDNYTLADIMLPASAFSLPGPTV